VEDAPMPDIARPGESAFQKEQRDFMNRRLLV
jgi:hypothetical protein